MKLRKIVFHLGLAIVILSVAMIFFHDGAMALTDAQKSSLQSFTNDLKNNTDIGNVTITETDPIFTSSAANGITSGNITAWNNKQAALGYTAANSALQINGHALSGNFNLSSTDVSAVSNAILVNGHALTANANVTASDVGLSSVENTALSTWSGTANIVTLGTITSGIWNGTAIVDAYIANAANWLTSAWTGSSNVVTLGTITTGVWHGTSIADANLANATKWNSNDTIVSGNYANWNNFSSANKVTFTTTGATTLTFNGTTGNVPLCTTGISANNVVCWKATGSIGHCNGNNTGSGTCNCI